jgi:phosphatidylglycerophosphate synthase
MKDILMEDTGKSARREVRARGSQFAKAIAAFLARSGIRPNTISFMSIFFAACCSVCLIMSSRTGVAGTVALLIASAALIQLRLLCNLFDGMVAIEGGLRTKSGEVFNDFPDRISDPLIIVSAAYAAPHMPYSLELGWLAGLLAVLTAYARLLGASSGANQYFSGPMAKQHRMAVMTVALLAAAALVKTQYHEKTIYAALTIIAAGCLITFFRRIRQSVMELESK